MTFYRHELYDAVDAATERLGEDRVAAIVRTIGGVSLENLDRFPGASIATVLKALREARVGAGDRVVYNDRRAGKITDQERRTKSRKRKR